MEENPSTLPIDPCPLCGRKHDYPLEIESSIVMALRTFGGSSEKPPKQKRFVRVFHCPVESKNFRATVTLVEASNERITGVTVGDPQSKSEGDDR